MVREITKILPEIQKNLQKFDELDSKVKLAYEKEILGLYISEHPMEKFDIKLNDSIDTISEIRKTEQKINVVTAGIITSIKKITTKNNEKSKFILIQEREILKRTFYRFIQIEKKFAEDIDEKLTGIGS